MPQPGEALHDKGRDGNLLARRWLDRTNRARISWSVHDNPSAVQMPQLSGDPKGYDLKGHLLDEDGNPSSPLLVEVKNYSTSGNQGPEYKKFLARSYSITAKGFLEGVDHGTQFMWLTWCPFEVTSWAKLQSQAWVRDALTLQALADEYLGGVAVDDGLVSLTAKRVFMVVLGARHEELTLPDWLQVEIAGIIERKTLA